MPNRRQITAEGMQKLEEELRDLKVNRRAEIAEKIKEAREQGDLSENAEYDAAKDEQRDIEARIEEIEKLLKEVEVVDAADAREGHISLGDTVTVHDVEYDEDMEIRIVGSTEANSIQNLISIESPMGQALNGKKEGDTVTVEAPAGKIRYKILKITK